jgi:PAS domain S-box-containing protein
MVTTLIDQISEDIVETIREPLLVLDSDLKVILANQSFYDSFKVKPEETVGQLIYDLGNKQWDIPKLRELLETILPEKTSFDDYEVEHDFATIGKRVMLLNARQIEQAMGKERIILLAIEDITERKLAEKTAIDERNFSNTLIANQPDIFYVLDPTGRFIRWNDKLKDMLGYSDSQIAATNALDVIHEADRPSVAQKTQEAFEQGTATNVARLVTKTGIRDFSLTAARVDTAKGAYVVGIGTDITERKQAEEERDKLVAELQKVLSEVKTLQGFLPICSHCKKIRDDKGYWNQIEDYIHEHSEAEFSHSICKECAEKYYPDMDIYDD